jgi:phosphoesterase RecJ-like protein
LFEGGRLVISYLLKDDFTDAGAEAPYSEGIIDQLRAVEGTEAVALIREPPGGDGGEQERRVSLRSSHDEVDVSAIARERGGGGHRQAAGFSSDESIEDIIAFIHREFVRATKGA